MNFIPFQAIRVCTSGELGNIKSSNLSTLILSCFSFFILKQSQTSISDHIECNSNHNLNSFFGQNSVDEIRSFVDQNLLVDDHQMRPEYR